MNLRAVYMLLTFDARWQVAGVWQEVAVDGSYMLGQDCTPGVDYSQVDLVVGEETLSHHMIDPSYPANSTVYFQVVARVEVVSLCQGVGGVGLRHFEEEVEESTSYVAEREETWEVEVGHIVR
jgi:hypothetical protein